MGSATHPIDFSERVRHGRSVNAVAEFLRSTLRVPNIYIEPAGAVWSNVDIVAADGAGSGDIHAVEIKLLAGPLRVSAAKQAIEQLKDVPAHYKYLAVDKDDFSVAFGDHLFSSTGIGRVGLLLLSKENRDGLPTVGLGTKPERFRLTAEQSGKVERFLAKAKPDMFVRV